MLYVCNAPSAAAISAFPIGGMIADRPLNSSTTGIGENTEDLAVICPPSR
ncbi:hypothetical protein NKI35_28115 [Mesorhizobium sp. M0676]